METVKLMISILFIQLGLFTYAESRRVDVDNIRYVISDDGTCEMVSVLNAANFKELTLPEYVIVDGNSYELVSIGERAFDGCGNMSEFSIPRTVKTVGKGAFSHLGKLQKVTFGEAVESIGDYAFYDCQVLREVVFNKSLRSIGAYAFNGCPAIENLSIPGSVGNLGYSAFSGCYGLRSFRMEDSEQPLEISENFGSAYPNLTIAYIGRPIIYPDSEKGLFDMSSLIQAEVGVNVTDIPANTFRSCRQLSNIVLHEGLKCIGKSSFQGCVNLLPVLPSGIETIDSSAFSGCHRIERLELPAGLVELGSEAFFDCDLYYVSFPSTIKVVGSGALCSNYRLTFIEIPDLTSWCSVVLDGSLADKGDLFCGDKPVKDLDIPIGVETVNSNVFGLWNFQDVILPEGLKSIGENAFGHVANLIINSSVVPEVSGNSIISDTVTLESKSVYDEFKVSENWKNMNLRYPALSSNALRLSVGDECKIQAVWMPVGDPIAEEKYGLWSTDNNVLQNTSFTEFKAVGRGSCKVKCSIYPFTLSCDVEVDQPIKDISFDCSSATIEQGKSVKLVPVIKPDDATVSSLQWSSSDPNVAVVNDGVVYGVSTGTTIITVLTQNGQKASCEVEVVEPKTIIIGFELGVGSELKLSVASSDLQATYWTSADETIAIVDNDGTVKAISVGETTISVSIGDSVAECNIIVEENNSDIVTVEYAMSSVSVSGSLVEIKNANEYDKVKIVRIDGVAFYDGDNLNYYNLPQGVYVVNINERSFKVIIR